MPEANPAAPNPSLLLILLIAALLPFAFASPAAGAIIEYDNPFASAQESRDLPWNLKADRLEVNQKKKVAQAFGNVLLSRKDSFFQADYARYNWQQKKVYLRGSVRARWKNDTVKAKEAKFDLQSNTGWLKDGEVFLHEPHLYFEGQHLEKTGPETYSFEQAEVTACDGEVPAWSLKTARGRITIDGYARLWHSRFRIKNRPLLYSPYTVLPVKRQRQSGFLLPEYVSSSRDGTGFVLPYYYAINQEQDATLYASYLSNRGAMLGTEYRLTPNLQSKGVFQLDFLRDQISADTEAEEEAQFSGDNMIRSNRERYWLRGKYNGFIGSPEWETKLDLDLVSDQNYLREFDSGYLGFERSRDIFLEQFGRDIQDKDDLLRESVWSISRNWAAIGLQSRIEYNQNLRYFNDNHLSLEPEDNDTLQRLPELNLNFYRRQLLDSPLEWEAQNELTHFWRRSGTTGSRIDLHPKLNWRMDSRYGTLNPQIGWRQTLYYIDNFEENADNPDDFQERGIWDFRINTFSELYRIFDLKDPDGLIPSAKTLGRSQWSKIKHSLRPEIEYSYIPEEDQSDLPDFDSVDRIEPENELTYSLTNVFTVRTDQVVSQPGGNGTEFNTASRYRDILRLKLEQSYDLEEADREESLDRYPRRPFSDIRLEATFKPCSWLSLEDRTWFSPYIGGVTEHEHMLRLKVEDWFSAHFGYDYKRELEEDIRRKNQEALSILRTGGQVGLGDHWKVNFDYERDLETSESITQRLGLTYSHQCWGVSLDMQKEQDETRLTIMISLHQLGAIEQTLSAPGE